MICLFHIVHFNNMTGFYMKDDEITIYCCIKCTDVVFFLLTEMVLDVVVKGCGRRGDFLILMGNHHS